ncbi:hypothetical protein JQ580_30695 [Bradyrhizobium japonicum]|jgi:hypothetical protein|uniref:hypothetical protein n=1 Tax=Bradyrhizobium japonicum TaxID=375 RepID=UPI001BA7F6E8|nr:hypothetical protein [Bradyrhizobium japonicum]MBR0995086.1 hypothetical protein [Bradyrhizobium japonicum]
MAISLAERAAQLDAEQNLLVKADRDIEEGRRRIRNQEDRIRELMACGYDTSQAERLADLLRQTLVEWKRHRVLIAQRVEYLAQEVAAG